MGSTRGPELDELLGPLECSVMRALWHASPATVAAVRARVNHCTGADLAYTTVMTVLGRLHHKGLVARSKQGRGYVYSPCHSEDELVEVLSSREVDRVLDRYGDAALSAFVTKLEGADPALLDRLRRLADGPTS